MTRRTGWGLILPVIIAMYVLTTPVGAEEPAFAKQTFTYKTAGDIEVKADVYRYADEKPQPVLVWIHGGALLMGSRSGVPPQLLDLCKSDGFVLVSLDYRLAP